MHQLIHGLVYADSSDEALETAKHDVFQPLVRRGVYDYFVTFDQDGKGVSGADRWNGVPEATKLETEEGRELVDRGWNSTMESYRHSFERVQELLDTREPRSFWEDSTVHREYRSDFLCIGEREGPSTYLYDQDGEGIRTKDHLQAVEDGWPGLYDSDPFENLDLYVVPADVHY